MEWQEIKELLLKIYPSKDVEGIIRSLQTTKPLQTSSATVSSKNTALITYASTFTLTGATPLSALYSFLTKYSLNSYLDIIHILPFYPWDTDRGFSVMNFYEVKKEYGTWKDIENLSKDYKLMFDFVANHVSVDNPLVQGALICRHLQSHDPRKKGCKKYENFVIAFDNDKRPTKEDLKMLVRPRATDVLTEYSVFESVTKKLQAVLGNKTTSPKDWTYVGGGWVWTTFSRVKRLDGTEDTRQVDLNYSNPQVFLEAIRILLFYCEKGASIIRLDAIGYLWKKLGSHSLHEPEVHLLLEAMVNTLKMLAPNVVCIAEINEPQDKVIKYLGSSQHKEADVVYQFTHFPLALHAVLTGTAKYYTEWLKTTANFKGKQFITILGSHDGLGLKPATGVLPDEEIAKLKTILIDHNKGLPNYSILPGGEKIVYEICGTPWNLINGSKINDFQQALDKYLAVVVLGLTVKGISAIYINGLLGSKNYIPASGLDENRTVNREEFDLTSKFSTLADLSSQETKVLSSVLNLLKIKNTEPTFSADAKPLEIIDTKNDALICIKLTSKAAKNGCVFIVVNCSEIVQRIALPFSNDKTRKYIDLISKLTGSNKVIELKPFQSQIFKLQS